MAADESQRTYDHPLYRQIERTPGVSVAMGNVDELLTWGSANSRERFEKYVEHTAGNDG